MSTCYDNGGITTGAVLSGGAAAGCQTLPTTSPLMNYISLVLLAVTAIFVGLLIWQMTKRGKRLPFMRTAATANSAPLSPTTTARHARIRGKHRN